MTDLDLAVNLIKAQQKWLTKVNNSSSLEETKRNHLQSIDHLLRVYNNHKVFDLASRSFAEKLIRKANSI